jgi:hypothetical protein
MPSRLLVLLTTLVAAAAAAAGPSSAAQATGCHHADVVFYSTNSAILAQRLHANPSACADAYISVTPAADGISPRAGVAPGLRTNGAHAMPELRLPGWAAWVAANHATWYDAGVEARSRMVTAGFDVSKGDTWAVNEVGSPSKAAMAVDVFNGAGTARADLTDFVRGLYTGAPGMPPSAGVVFVANPTQVSPDLSSYQAQLQRWYSDSAFWTGIAPYVRSWSQETYTDARSWGVPGSSLAERTQHLNDYFQHGSLLAAAGPGASEAARSFLQAAYTPMGNMAYPQPAPELNSDGIGFGFTNIPLPAMLNFVSAQTYALRATPNARFGFAWTTATTLSSIVDRFATALRDSESDPAGACGPTGDSCTGTVDGAKFTEAWKALATWSPSTNTPEGPQVTVHVAPGVTVTYAAVSSRGSTQASSVSPAPAPPVGFQRLPGAPAYGLDTTAAFAGPLVVCLDVDPATFAGYTPALFELVGGSWAALTATAETTAGSICASASTLGPFAVFAGDPTPPTVVAHVTGALGNDGWYTGDVTVTWELADLQSAVTSTPGCAPATIGSDTIGTTLECTATSDGGPTTEAVTIKRDATPPAGVAIALARSADSNGWYNHAVAYAASGTDETSGIATCSAGTYDGPDTGAASVTGSCTDAAGNTTVASPVTFAFDATPPTVTAARLPESAPNAAGWNDGDVTVRFTVQDSMSGPASSFVDVVVSTEGAGQSVERTIADTAGNTASASIGDISIDKTPPTLAVPSAVTVDATSASGATATFEAQATDALDPAPTGVCLPASGGLFPIGTTSVTCTATDRAGNVSTASFSVHVRGAAEQVRILVKTVVASTTIPRGAKVSLLAKLVVVLARLELTNTSAQKACPQLDAFASELRNLERDQVPAATGDPLLADSARIDAVLGC